MLKGIIVIVKLVIVDKVADFPPLLQTQFPGNIIISDCATSLTTANLHAHNFLAELGWMNNFGESASARGE